MGNHGPGGRSGGITRWLVPALLLHATAALGLAALFGASASSGARGALRASSVVDSSSSEFTFLEDDAPSSVTRGSQRASVPLEPTALSARESGAVAAERHPDARQGSEHALRAEDRAAVELEGAAADSSELAELPAAQAWDSAAAGANHGDAPTLSLDQLGIGATNQFLASASDVPSLQQSVQRRLQESLRQGVAASDPAHGGVDGPVLGAARELLWANESLLETSAVFNVLVDAMGHVRSVEVLQVSNQMDDWQRMAGGLMTALGPVALHVAPGKGEFGMKIRIASALRLPSGAAPGLRTDLLGQTLHDGDGPGSASLSLSPTAPLALPKVFDSAGQQLDRPLKLEVGLLKLQGDLADLGASARRVVQVSLLALDASEQR